MRLPTFEDMTTHQAPVHPGPQTHSPPSIPTGLATATQAVAALWVVLAIGRAATAPAVTDSITGAGLGSEAAYVLVSGLASLMMIVQILAWIVAGLWLYLFVEAARQLNRESWHDREPYWAFLGWVAPLVNLWFPYQVVRDGAAAVGAGTRLVGWWWAGWLVTGILTGAESVALAASSGDATPWLVTSTVLALATLVTGALWIRIVRSMTSAAREAVSVR